MEEHNPQNLTSDLPTIPSYHKYSLCVLLLLLTGKLAIRFGTREVSFRAYRVGQDPSDSKPNRLHPKLRNINLHNITHSLISQNPTEWMMFIV